MMRKKNIFFHILGSSEAHDLGQTTATFADSDSQKVYQPGILVNNHLYRRFSSMNFSSEYSRQCR